MALPSSTFRSCPGRPLVPVAAAVVRSGAVGSCEDAPANPGRCSTPCDCRSSWTGTDGRRACRKRSPGGSRSGESGTSCKRAKPTCYKRCKYFSKTAKSVSNSCECPFRKPDARATKHKPQNLRPNSAEPPSVYNLPKPEGFDKKFLPRATYPERSGSKAY